MRSGFKGHSNEVSGAFLLAYNAVGLILEQQTTGIDVPPFFTDYRIGLPPLSNVVLANVGNGNFAALLQDVKLRLSLGLNYSVSEGKTFNGTVQFAVDLEPQMSLDLNKGACGVNVTNAGIYNLGLGLADQNKFFRTESESLSGPSHSGLRGNCTAVLPALPGQQLVKTRFPFGGVGRTLKVPEFPSVKNQGELDAQCCQACNEIPECDAFETSDKWSQSRHTCTLRSYSSLDAKKHANVRGNRFAKNSSGSTYDIDGEKLATHPVGSGVGYAGDVDAECMDLCDQMPQCQIWSADANAGRCTLKRFSKPTGLASKWWGDGVNSQGLGNQVVAELWRRIMVFLLKAAHLCDNGASGELASLIDVATAVATGNYGDVKAEAANLISGVVDSMAAALRSDLADLLPAVSQLVRECLDMPTKCSALNLVHEVLV
jgi:hypothetical protein